METSTAYEYWRGRLPEEEASKISAALLASPDLARQYREEEQLFVRISKLREFRINTNVIFSSAVMAKIETQSRLNARLRLLKFVPLLIVALGATYFLVMSEPEPHINVSGGLATRYNDVRLVNSLNAVFTYVEGAFGALVMVMAGIGAMIAAGTRRFKVAGSLCTVALAAFVLRSVTATFFNDNTIREGGGESNFPGNFQRPAPRMHYNDSYVNHSPQNIRPYSAAVVTAPAETYNSGSYYGGKEKYGEYDENPRFITRETPFSTFSVDVDTGSYSNMRRFLRAGTLPPRESVRVEEFVNYFKYDYRAPTNEAFAVDFEAAPSPLQPDRHLLRIALKARQVPRDNEHGWNLVFLIDVSGSMASNDKLPLVQKSLRLLVERMRPGDRVAIVTYAGDVSIPLDSTSGSEKARILSVVDGLQSGGSTNGGSGIDLAYRVAEANFQEGSTNRIILATDGDFNMGNYSFEGLMDLVEEKRRSGVTLTTLGFGQGNLNEHMMEQLSNRGNGNYFYIDSFKEARKVFDLDLFANVELVAKDVKLQLQLNPQHVAQYRLIGFDNRRLKTEDFSDDYKDAGEVGSGHTVTALYELVLAGSSPLKDEPAVALRYTDHAPLPIVEPADAHNNELGILSIRYKDPDSSRSKLIELPIIANDALKSGSEASADFRFTAAVAYFAALLRNSKYKGNYSFADVAELASSGKGVDHSGQRAEFIELVRDAERCK